MPTKLAAVATLPDFSNTSPGTVLPLLLMQPTPKTLIFALHWVQ